VTHRPASPSDTLDAPAPGGGERAVMAEVNDRIHQLAVRLDRADIQETWDFRCECSDPGCNRLVALALHEYEALRDQGSPILARGHQPHPAAQRERSARLQSDAQALRNEARHQCRRALHARAIHGTDPEGSRRAGGHDLVLRLPGPLAATDLAVHLEAYGATVATGGDEIHVRIEPRRRAEQLRSLLRSVNDWASRWQIEAIPIAIDKRQYRLTPARLSWTDIG
jgi:hypothetical protein